MEDEKLDQEVADDAPHPTAGTGFPDKAWDPEQRGDAEGPGEAQVAGGEEREMKERAAGGGTRPQSEAGAGESD